MAKQVLPATKNKKLVENPQPVHLFAEREGFEPPVPLSTTVFKTVVIDHSTISPVLECLKSGCKGKEFF